jgi:hypothetical protein
LKSRTIAAGELAFRRAVELRRCENMQKTTPAALPLRADGGFLAGRPSRGRKQLDAFGRNLSPSQKHDDFKFDNLTPWEWTANCR